MTASNAQTTPSRQRLHEAILLQERELRQRFAEPYVARLVHAPPWVQDNLIRVILDPRRAGKSFFAIHWMRQWGQFAYLNLDDEALNGLTDFAAVLPALDEVYPCFAPSSTRTSCSASICAAPKGWTISPFTCYPTSPPNTPSHA